MQTVGPHGAVQKIALQIRHKNESVHGSIARKTDSSLVPHTFPGYFLSAIHRQEKMAIGFWMSRLVSGQWQTPARCGTREKSGAKNDSPDDRLSAELVKWAGCCNRKSLDHVPSLQVENLHGTESDFAAASPTSLQTGTAVAMMGCVSCPCHHNDWQAASFPPFRFQPVFRVPHDSQQNSRHLSNILLTLLMQLILFGRNYPEPDV